MLWHICRQGQCPPLHTNDSQFLCIQRREQLCMGLAYAMLFSWQQHFPIICNKRSMEKQTASWSTQGHVNQDVEAVQATTESWCNNHSASAASTQPLSQCCAGSLPRSGHIFLFDSQHLYTQPLCIMFRDSVYRIRSMLGNSGKRCSKHALFRLSRNVMDKGYVFRT
jgi:hypothetical protein